MIKIDNVKVFNVEGAIHGMRNPMNSWDKSDSYVCENEPFENCGNCHIGEFIIGEKDFALMEALFKAGTEHRKYLRQIFVSCNILAPLYWWKEFDTYKVGTTANSCSTMHKIHSKKFVLDDFSCEKMSPAGLATLKSVIERLNVSRGYFVRKINDSSMGMNYKAYWWDMIQLLPSSYNQLRTVTMNYEVLANIINQRKNHKLDEWIKFCEIMLMVNPILHRLIGDVKVGN